MCNLHKSGRCKLWKSPRRELPQSLSCPCTVPGECGRHTVIPGRSSNCRPLQRRHHSEPVTEVTGMRISRMKGTMYRLAPKISPVYGQSMGGHRSPAPFNGEIPTPV